MSQIRWNNEKTARILTVACGLLFCAFSFIYLFVLQRDVMRALHYSLTGSENYSPFWGALLITAVLLILRWGINALLGLKGYVRTLSYFPSFLLLGVMTDVDYTIYQQGIAPYWSWLLPLLLLVFILAAFGIRRVCRQWMDVEIANGALVLSNLTLFLLLCFLTAGIGNTHIHLHHELAMAQALRSKDYPEARQIGFKLVHPNQAVTALRACALSQEGTMGEYLFQYPQPFRSEGLLIDPASEDHLPASVDSLYACWQAAPQSGEKALPFFRRLYQEQPECPLRRDYYLSALLLDKQLTAFVDQLQAVYDPSQPLPLHYREALFLYGKMHPEAGKVFTDETLEAAWQTYCESQATYSQGKGEANLMRRQYGKTYWWYYQY